MTQGDFAAPPEPSDHLRIVAVIQARMGSTRLPGKVLRPVAGKPLLWHIVHRLRRSSLIEQIAIATSVNPRDDAIAEFGREEGIAVVRGPEDNVLARFARAAELLDADVIVRVNADAPFIDAGFIDHLIAAMLEDNADFVLLEDGATTAHCGVDPMSRRALDKLMMDASSDAVAREHVTGYFKLHPDFVRVARAGAYPSLAKDGARLTIDTPDDLAFVELVHERLAANAGEASLSDLLLLLEREPQLREINAHVRQKALASSGGLALIRCDGGGRFGYGHVKRMIALARALRDAHGIGSLFAVHGSEDALTPVRAAGFEAQLLDDSDESAVRGLIAARAPDLMICDYREGMDRKALVRLKSALPLLVSIDDGSERRLAADLAYYPPVPQALGLEWTGVSARVHIGWEWALLGTQPRPRPRQTRSSMPRLLVTMGGSDPAGLTLRCARALAKDPAPFRSRFVIGAGMADGARTAKAIVALSPLFETLEGASDLSTEYSACDAALCAFGVSAYELAASGVPALYLGLTADHALSAGAMAAAGMGLSLGVADAVSDEGIVSAVRGLMGDSALRRQMRAAALAAIDGGGAARMAASIAEALAARQSGRSAASA